MFTIPYGPYTIQSGPYIRHTFRGCLLAKSVPYTVVGPNKGMLKFCQNGSNKGIFPLFAQFPYFKNFPENCQKSEHFMKKYAI